MKQPAVSVVMSVLNGERYIAQAIDSVLAQTCQDFELIIVDDASTDETPEILSHYASYEKVVILQNAENRERAYSRNKAIQQARGKYIAILDADDICLPSRLETQLQFMEQNPDIDVLGGKFVFIDDEGAEITKKQVRLQTHPEIAWATLFATPIAHSTAMARTVKLREVNGYDVRWPPCEDADLWIRLLKAGSKFHNLAAPLTKYRTNARQRDGFLSSLHKAKEIRRLFLEELLERDIPVDEYDLIFLNQERKSGEPIRFSDFMLGLHGLYSAFYAMKRRGYFINSDISLVEEEMLTRLAERINLLSISDKKTVLGSLSKFATSDWVEVYLKQKRKYLPFRRGK